MIKVIIFDLDGTVTNSEALHRQAFNILLKKYNLFINKRQWQSTFVGAGSRFIAKWHIQKYHLPEDLDDFVDQRRRKYQELLKKHPLKPIPGFKVFYHALKKAGYKTAIASSGHRSNVLASLRAIGLSRIPVIGIEQVHFRKPNPEIFLKTAKILGVRSLECVVFEDSVPGITAAKRAKMKVIALLTTTPKKKLQKLKPDKMISDYTHISVEYIEALQ